VGGGFDALLQMVTVAMVLTGSLTVASLFVLRRRGPATPRPYRATGYPWLPVFYLAASLALVVVMLATSLARDPPELLPLLDLAVLGVAYPAGRRAVPYVVKGSIHSGGRSGGNGGRGVALHARARDAEGALLDAVTGRVEANGDLVGGDRCPPEERAVWRGASRPRCREVQGTSRAAADSSSTSAITRGTSVTSWQGRSWRTSLLASSSLQSMLSEADGAVLVEDATTPEIFAGLRG